jgi:biopolymer transport protein ExbB/TolQ
VNGGWAVALLLGLSVLAVAILIDRWRAFSRAGRDRDELLRSLEPYWAARTSRSAKPFASGMGASRPCRWRRGARQAAKEGDPHAAMEREAKALLLRLETRLPLWVR